MQIGPRESASRIERDGVTTETHIRLVGRHRYRFRRRTEHASGEVTVVAYSYYEAGAVHIWTNGF